ncbi:hypothetical protein JCGZ_03512 [Jatropha curcas]|uniref:Uncharacterized protein n=1 Tax=Jatropha curcas TaxID=180498 RepID=A0A067KUT3_JATCU|nr:hypothetical protein JCGZ_03512 [Jatropha curcas]
MKQGAMMTVLSTFVTALAWPATLLAATDFIDSTWTIAIDSLFTQGLAGIQPIDVPGIENVDVTGIIEGHSSYLWATQQILEQLELDAYYPVFRNTVHQRK